MTAADIATAVVAAFQAIITVVEMAFWTRPLLYKRFDFDEAGAAKVAPIVRNMGLYNSFLAAGLAWSLLPAHACSPIRLFCLACVFVAGIFGAITLKKPLVLVIQTLPAAVALAFAWPTIAAFLGSY
jgi:putative membrane protein